MQKITAQYDHLQNQSAVQQGKGVAVKSSQSEQIAQLEAMIESSPQADRQAQLATMVNTSHAMTTQLKKINVIHGSSSMVVQRKAIHGIHNSSSEFMQRVEGPLQGKFETAQREACSQLKGENEAIWDWIKSGAATFLSGTAPGMVNDAMLSRAVRLRWFNVSIPDTTFTYTVGANIHYSGDAGAVWVINETSRAVVEGHPSMLPQHGLNSVIATAFPVHVQNWDVLKGTKLRAKIA